MRRPAAGLALAALVNCSPARTPAPAAPLAPVELAYQNLRYWDDQRRLLESLGRDSTPGGVPAAEVADSLAQARARFAALRDAGANAGATPEDRRALAAMDQAWKQSLAASSTTAPPDTVSCAVPSATLDTSGGLQRLTARTYLCYARAATRVVIDGDTLNRLEVLGLLTRVADPARRRRLFLALQPVWHSVNGDDGPGSPYRAMLRLRRAAWAGSLSPVEEKAPAFGLTTAELEDWLERGLRRWRVAMPDTLLEPWEWYYYTGSADRTLSPRIRSVADLRRVNDAWYRAIGADPALLNVHYDLASRPGKSPVAFTDFGRRNQWLDGRFLPGEPWVFTSYISGGLGNLAELLHETGHAIHLAGIRTRPAWQEWPDNDTFTEALADLPALDLYEPAWQQRFLGDSAPLAASLRARYAGIVFDFAWALFEIRVHRQPEADPNVVWSAVVRDYLGIRPHPEWSWWAMRGQLVDSPGYLVNYALGAFLVADMRHRIAEQREEILAADSTLYPWLTARLYRFGAERPARQVLEDFLGRPVRPDALLEDLARMHR